MRRLNLDGDDGASTSQAARVIEAGERFENLRGRSLRWQKVGKFPLDVHLSEGDSSLGQIYGLANDKPIAFAGFPGIVLKLAWTELFYFRLAFAESGMHVGEARYLPWRRDTFQARLEGIRAYRLVVASPLEASWQLSEESLMRFRRSDVDSEEGDIGVSEKIEPLDAVSLLALGILLNSEDRLFTMPKST